jgi:HTH-type transcriptional regulator / antitoxin HigA
MATEVQVHSDLAIPPGEYLAEVLTDLGMSQADLARRMGRPEQMVSEILGGAKRITPETALQLERVTGVPANVWTGLEEEYQLTMARALAREQVAGESVLVDLETYRELARLGFVATTRDRSLKVRELWRFFGVASLRNVPQLATYNAAFRVSAAGRTSPYALAAWLRCGELAAADAHTDVYSAQGLRALVPELRSWTRDRLGGVVPKVRAALAARGVALVIVPHLPRTRVHGATFWVSQEKAVVQMSLRGAWSDVFWFSLFHEIGHVLLHGKRQVFLEGYHPADPDGRAWEKEADTFASERLIPRRSLDAFLAAGVPTTARILSFAERVGVAPGIVVGRLQHLGAIRHDQFNGLRERAGMADVVEA